MAFGDLATERAEQDPGQAKERHTCVADPAGGTHVVHHHDPQWIEHADHHVEREADQDRANEWPDAQQVEGESFGRLVLGRRLWHVCPSNDDGRDEDQGGHDQEGSGQTERIDREGRNHRTERESTDFDRDAAAEVATDVVAVAHDDDAPGSRNRDAGADSHQRSTEDECRKVGAECHHERTDDVERESDREHLAGEALVGQWCERELRDERSEEAHCDDESEPSFLDAEFVPPVVQHREHHAVTGGKQTDCDLQNEDESPSVHPATIGVTSHNAP